MQSKRDTKFLAYPATILQKETTKRRTGGWISLWREIQQFELWPGNRDVKKEPFTRFEAWIDILLSASYEDHVFTLEGEQLEERRGEWVVSIRYLGSRWGWSKEKVSNFLTFLNRLGEIDHSTGSITGRIPGKIIVIKYDIYQTHGVQNRTHERTHKGGVDNIPEAGSPQEGLAGRIPDAPNPHLEEKSENQATKNRTKPNKIKNSIAAHSSKNEQDGSSLKGNIPHGGDGKPSPDDHPPLEGGSSREPQDLAQIEKRAGTSDKCSPGEVPPRSEPTPSDAGTSRLSWGKGKRGESDPRVKKVIDYFHEKFKEKDGHDYLMPNKDRGKYSTLVKKVLESEQNKWGFTLNEMKMKIDAYFGATWITEFSFAHFIKKENLNKWAQKEIRNAREEREREEERKAERERTKAHMRKLIIEALEERGPQHEEGGESLKEATYHCWGDLDAAIDDLAESGTIRTRPDLGERVWDLSEAVIEARGLDREQREEQWKDSEWRRTNYEGWLRAKERKEAAHMKEPIREYLENGPVSKRQLMAERWFDHHAQVAFEELVDTGVIIESDELEFQCCGPVELGARQFKDYRLHLEEKEVANGKNLIWSTLEEGPSVKRAFVTACPEYGLRVAYKELVETGEIIESDELGFQCCGLKKLGEHQFKSHASSLRVQDEDFF